MASANGASGGMAAIVTHGTADTTVDISLGRASADFWSTEDGCMSTMANDSTLQGCTTYQGCRASEPVSFCTHSGAHMVPSNGGANIWSFFSHLKRSLPDLFDGRPHRRGLSQPSATRALP